MIRENKNLTNLRLPSQFLAKSPKLSLSLNLMLLSAKGIHLVAIF